MTLQKMNSEIYTCNHSRVNQDFMCLNKSGFFNLKKRKQIKGLKWMKKVSQHDDLDAGHGRSCLGLMMVVVSNLVGGARQSMTHKLITQWYKVILCVASGGRQSHTSEIRCSDEVHCNIEWETSQRGGRKRRGVCAYVCVFAWKSQETAV